MSKINFGGIVAVGSSQGQAVQRYRLLSMGKGARCFVDQANGIAFVSNASADLESTFNPINGNLDLSLSDEALEGLEFQAQASDTQDAYWLHCTAGCGAHSIFDSQAMVKHCPMCGVAADLSEDADEEDSELDDLIVGNEDDDEVDIDEESIDEEEEVDEDDGADEEDDSALAADDNDSDDEDDSDDDSDEDDSDDDGSDEDLDDDVEEDVEVEEVDTEENDDMADDNAPLVVVASTRSRAVRRYSELMSKSEGFTATASGEINADYKVCASENGCGSHVVSTEELSNCPAEGCGEELSEPVLALDPEAGELADDEENAEDDEFIGADEDDVDEEEDDDISEDDEEDAVDNADEETEELDEANDDVGSDNSLSITASDDADEDQEADEDIADQSDDVESDDSDTVELDLLEEMPADAEESDLDIAFASSIAGVPTYIALHKGRPVATATASSIRGDISELFGTSRFTQVVIAAARIKNPKEVLIDLGFKGVAASLNVSANVQSRVDAGIALARAAMDEERGEFSERFKSALATASIGITRGYFAGLQNDVREALCSELTEAGIRNPETIVDRAMKNGMEPFLAAAMDKADQIMEKAPEVQEELARTVVEMGYKPVEGKLSAVAADHAASHRLEGIGHVVTASSGNADNKKPASTTQIVAQASDQQATARINNAVATLGRPRR